MLLLSPAYATLRAWSWAMSGGDIKFVAAPNTTSGKMVASNRTSHSFEGSCPCRPLWNRKKPLFLEQSPVGGPLLCVPLDKFAGEQRLFANPNDPMGTTSSFFGASGLRCSPDDIAGRSCACRLPPAAWVSFLKNTLIVVVLLKNNHSQNRRIKLTGCCTSSLNLGATRINHFTMWPIWMFFVRVPFWEMA